MTKKLWLSHTQISTFKECERKFYIERVARIRPIATGSALIFGSAFDETTEHILLKKEGDPKEVFLDKLANIEVNRKPKKLPEDLLSVKFFASNVDHKILKEVDLTEDFERLGIDPIEVVPFLDYCKQQRKSKTALEDTEQLLFNTLAYRTIQQTGLMFIDVFTEWVEENVKEVHAVQKKIEVEDGDGNKFTGYLDFILTLNNGKKVLIDLKTSSNPKLYYPPESASESHQLGIYAQEEGLPDVAYLVFDKNIRVRDPKVRLHFIEGVITSEFLDEVFDEIETVVEMISEKKEYGEAAFDKNKEACMNFGGCAYRDLCWKGKMDGLEKV